MTAPRPGWYPDPAATDASSSSPGFRWWDGSGWTDAVSDSATAPSPSDPQPAGHSHPRRNDHGSRPTRVAALALGIGLMLSGGLLGTFGWIGVKNDKAAGPPVPTPTASETTQPPERTASPAARGSQAGSGPAGQLDEVSGEARIAGARMVLPPAPYELVSDPLTVPNVFDAMFVAGAPVHPRYNGSDSWSATVALAHVPARSFESEDPVEFAHRALDGVTERFFDGHPTKIKKLHYSPTVIDGQVCAELSAHVHYKIKKLDSRYDQLRVIGCPTENGSLVAAISSIPDDADPELSRLAEHSLDSLNLN